MSDDNLWQALDGIKYQIYDLPIGDQRVLKEVLSSKPTDQTVIDYLIKKLKEKGNGYS